MLTSSALLGRCSWDGCSTGAGRGLPPSSASGQAGQARQAAIAICTGMHSRVGRPLGSCDPPGTGIMVDECQVQVFRAILIALQQLPAPVRITR